MEWVQIPAGVVVRGTPADAIDAVVAAHAELEVRSGWFLKEVPQAEVAVPAFAMSRMPVTAGQFARYAAQNGLAYRPGSPDDHPAVGISYAWAQGFCEWASETTGISVRLPSELEWERAARGDDGREYPWGDIYDPDRCNLAERGTGGTLPVSASPGGMSPFGLLDMAGNVDEWTSTTYTPYPGAPPEVPQTESWALDTHVTRGGAWYHHRDLARCARRHSVYERSDGVGFRVATDAAQ